MADKKTPATDNQETTQLSPLDQIIVDGKMFRSEEQRSIAIQMIREFVNQILEDETLISASVMNMVNTQIAKIDELISAQLNEIMHHDDFQTIEAAWRGLHHFVMNTETGESLKLRVLNATKVEVSKDLEKAIEFDQSHLFKLVYEDEYGTFGGTPYSLLIGDYFFGRSAPDVQLLMNLSNVAAAAHAPFIAGTAPEMFDLDSFTDLPNPRDLKKIFESTELIKWRSFRETEDARYTALVLPHILLRTPYGPEKPIEEFNFIEKTDGKDHKKYLWGNAVYALGERITEAFAKYKWCAAIRGVEGGGLVENLPIHTFKTDDGDIVAKCPTEIAITDRREKEISDLGFISLCYEKNTDRSAFFGSSTTNKAKEYFEDDATANAFLSAQLPYILAASRFAHYIKVIVRDKIGAFTSQDELSDFLNSWISNYVLLSKNAHFSVKASTPLSGARVDVTADPARPGRYRAIVYLKPHFQLDEVNVSLRLVANLPPPAAV